MVNKVSKMADSHSSSKSSNIEISSRNNKTKTVKKDAQKNEEMGEVDNKPSASSKKQDSWYSDSGSEETQSMKNRKHSNSGNGQ